MRLVRESGRLVSVAAKDLGVSTESLRQWVAQADLDSGRRKNAVAQAAATSWQPLLTR